MRIFVFVALLASHAAAQLAPGLQPFESLPKIKPSEEGYADAEHPQSVSLAGNALFALKDKDGLVAKAEKAFAAKPEDANLLLAAGRQSDALLRYQDSTFIYGRGIEKFPKDWRFLRYRGHRFISLRKFPEAIADLESARKMSSDSFDVAYYLGLAYYFNGQHDKAVEEFTRCQGQMKGGGQLSGARLCADMKEDASLLVPMQYWHYLALRRAGKMEAAKDYLKPISPMIDLKANKPYHDALLFFKGVKEINEMLAGASEGNRDYLTRSSGAASFLFTAGERGQACSIWQRITMDSNWDHLGVILAESEVYLNSKSACALYGQPAPKP
jgi:tetratricopeptide (TPR) repeat protein